MTRGIFCSYLPHRQTLTCLATTPREPGQCLLTSLWCTHKKNEKNSLEKIAVVEGPGGEGEDDKFS